MHTNDERIALMHDRAKKLRREERSRYVRVMQTLSAAASFAAVILLAVFMPKTSGFSAGISGAASSGMQGSMLSGTNALGYVVIAFIAFILGTSVTIFCIRLKKWNEEKDKEDRL
ncbi:MAG: hypothetical protein IKF07_02265 [Eubacterium sp.]|nr:hypothetical protein [Eubacterium sp.]